MKRTRKADDGENCIMISEAELIIMQVIWQAGGPLTVHDVYERLKASENWQYNTVATFMTRLVDKGYLTYDQLEGRGRTRLFSPRVSEKTYQQNHIRHMIQRQFRGSAKAFFTACMSHETIDHDEIDELRKWLDDQ